jgi:integrase
MAIEKRGKHWYIRVRRRNGKRLQFSAKTTSREEAQRLHDELVASLWKQEYLNEKPRRTWKEASEKYVQDIVRDGLRSAEDLITRVEWWQHQLKGFYLDQINREAIETSLAKKEKDKVSPATINRYLEVLRRVLRLAVYEWEWLDKMPIIKLRKLNNKRVRWLTFDEAAKLLGRLPPHLRDMAIFTLQTGLRESNVTQLKWSQVDFEQKRVIIEAHQSKTKKPIKVPLNTAALKVLKAQKKNHAVYVFTYYGKPIRQAHTHAFRKALKDVGIKDFRWHDLRHTWASWHVQNGTSLHELQELGGWNSHEMVLRYAHLSADHLQEAAKRIRGIKWVDSYEGRKRDAKKKL